jgi:hypothetical protein
VSEEDAGIDSIAGICKQFMRARNRVGIELSYRPARLHRPGGIHSLESIPGFHKRSKIGTVVALALVVRHSNHLARSHPRLGWLDKFFIIVLSMVLNMLQIGRKGRRRIVPVLAGLSFCKFANQ